MTVMAANCQPQSVEVEMKQLLYILSALLGAIYFTVDAAADPKKLNGMEITKLLKGHVLVGPLENATTILSFRADGALDFESTDGKKLGLWKVVGDKYCVAWDEKSEPK